MLFEPRACDLPLGDVENALLRGAFGDYADEAAVLLLLNWGHWLPALRVADLITVSPDFAGEGMWAAISWPDLEMALTSGRISGDDADVRVLRAAASLTDGQPVDLGDVAAGLDRRGLELLFAAIAHAAGSHDQGAVGGGRDGIADPGQQSLPPLAPWPPRD